MKYSYQQRGVPKFFMRLMNAKAVTLLENLVSLVILMLIVSGMVGVFIAGRKHTLHSRSMMTAGELGRYYLTPMQELVRQDTWNSNCLGTKNGAACDSEPLLAVLPVSPNDIAYTRTYQITDAPGSTDVRRVKVIISWNEPTD